MKKFVKIGERDLSIYTSILVFKKKSIKRLSKHILILLFSFSSAKATTKPNHNLQPSLEFWEQELEDLERLEEKQIEKGYLKNILKSSSVRLAKKSKTGNVYSETEISAIIKKRLSGLKLTRINGLTYRHRERRTGTTPAPIRELTENEASFSKWACSWISWLATWKFP